MEKLINSIQGNGTVFKNNKPFFDVSFSLRIYQQMVQVKGKLMPAQKRIEGHVQTKDPLEIVRLRKEERDTVYVLKLQDGRRLKFVLAKNDGTISPAGDFF